MLTKMKKFWALLLTLVMVLSCLPVGSVRAEEAAVSDVLDAADYASADAVFAKIDAVLNAPAKKDASEIEKTEAAKNIVLSSASYVEGSLQQNGNVFTWWTEEGVHCVYSPRMQKINKELTPENGENAVINAPVATKGGSPSGNQVYLVGPYYGYDDSFTNQYKNTARQVATAIGDTDGYTLISGTAATVDKVAEAVSNGAVVFFDSHGDTDYVNPNDEYDYFSGATNSYLCLTSTTGLTDADYADGALYYSDGICINGATIANHMTKNSPSGFLWMAICLGMATDTMCEPLREKGVEVVYGYSQSVTFEGDYRFGDAFWSEMIEGKTVAESIATMKNTWGEWDWSTQIANDYGTYDGYSTISSARNDYMAFPVVVSDEDAYPGQRKGTNYGVDSLQTVKSTYSLGEIHEVVIPTDPKAIVSEIYSLNAGEDLPYTPTLTGTITQVYTAYNATYKNVTVIMTVAGCEDMPIKCYRLEGSGADQIGVGDTITVTGTVTAYQHSSGDLDYQFKAGCTLVSWVDGGSAPETPDTPETPDIPAESTLTIQEACDLGLSMEHNTYTTAKYYVTGVISEVYNTTYGNLRLKDEAGNVFTIYGTYSADGSIRYDAMSVKPVAGDTVTIYGNIGQYNGTPQIKDGWLIAHTAAGGGQTPEQPDQPDTPVIPDGPVSEGAVLDFTNVANRESWDASQQTWKQNGITLVNNKAASSSNVADYSNPARFYKNSAITVVAADMIKLVFTCGSSTYAAALSSSISGATVTVSGNDVTIELPSAADTFEIANLSGGQVRVSKLTVYVAGGSDDSGETGCVHVYTSVVTAPTATQQGFTTHTCTLCGNSYVDSYVPALGYNYTVSFAVPAGVDAISPVISNTNTGITLPTAAVPSGYTGYSFAGWAVEAVEETTDAPALLTGKYVASSDVTLYPVYSYTEGGTGTGSGSFQKVTNVASLQAGMEVIIVANDYNYAMAITQNKNNRASAAITKNSDGSITYGSDVAVFILENGTVSGTFAFGDASGYLCSASSSSNYLRSQAKIDANASWKITIDASGKATIVAQGSYTRNTMQYNAQNSPTIFGAYASASQKPLVLYARSSDGTTYYTSLGAAAGDRNVAAGENYYATVSEALLDESADYIVLLDDVEDDIIITSDAIIDLNGYILAADIQIADGVTLYLFDSATADYTSENRGGIIGAVEGNLAPVMNTPESYGHNYKYLTIQEEDGIYTAHRIYLAVKSATLVPQTEDGATKISYKTVFKCSDLVASYVEAYGAQITGDTTVTSAYSMELAAGTNEGIVWLVNSLSAENSDEVNAANALAAPAVSAYIQIGGEIIASASVSLSIQDLIVAADAMELTNIQKVALGYMYSLFQPIMDAWDVSIENIKSYGQYWN